MGDPLGVAGARAGVCSASCGTADGKRSPAAAGMDVQEAVRLSIYLPVNARVMTAAMGLSDNIKALAPGEIEIRRLYNPKASESWRAWEYWAGRAGVSDLLGPAP